MFRDTPKRAPPAPRAITADMRHDTIPVGQFIRLFGAIWAGVGFTLAIAAALLALAVGNQSPLLGAAIGGAFGLAGTLLHLLGRFQRARALRVFRDGVEAEAQVVSVSRDYRARMNGRNPWRLVYEFMVGGRAVKGVATWWTPEPPVAPPGTRLIILHDADNPSRSVLWTRLDTREGAADSASSARIRIDASADSPPPEDASDETDAPDASEDRTAAAPRR